MPHHLTLYSFPPRLLLDIADFFAEHHGTSLLYSGGTLDSARYSFLGLFPYQSATVFDQLLTIQNGDKEQQYSADNPWDGLQEHFFSHLASNPHAMAFGWFGYGMGRYADPDLSLPYRPNTMPDAYWQRCAITLTVDHQSEEATIQIHSNAFDRINREARPWLVRLKTLDDWQRFLSELSSTPTDNGEPSAKSFTDQSHTQAAFIEKVIQAQELIRAGDIYQVNLSQEFAFGTSRRPFSLFRQIGEHNPAPFSAYFRWKESTVISTSPERFLSKKGDRLETRPIKGTIQRGSTAEEDQALKECLLASPKERAELLMITDLMRNDLGKISQTGSVVVEDLWRCEAYTNVFHLVSIISSLAKEGIRPLEIVRSCFPGGSITGCPKLKAMEVIDRLENRSRGLYTGSIGYFSGSGNFDLNIAIRTLVMDQSSCTLQLGSGIVYDSNPVQEYQETLFKGESFFNLLQSQLPEEGLVHGR